MRTRLMRGMVIAGLAFGLLSLTAAADGGSYRDLTTNTSTVTQTHYTSTQQPPSDDGGKPIKN